MSGINNILIVSLEKSLEEISNLKEDNYKLHKEIEKLQEDFLNMKSLINENRTDNAQGVLKKRERVSTKKAISKYKDIIEKLTKDIAGIEIMNGKRTDSCDIVIKQHGNNIKIRLLVSKNHGQNKVSGWHRLSVEDLEKVDINIFLIEEERLQSKYKAFILSKGELLELCKLKKSDNLNLYHFYFCVDGDKKNEFRDGEIKAEQYFENWQSLKDILIGKM